MPLHDKAFWAIAFFLGGVLLWSTIEGWESRWLVAIAAAAFLATAAMLARKRTLAFLAVFLLAGFGYHEAFTLRADARVAVPFGEVAAARGIVTDVSRGLESQRITVSLAQPNRGKVQLTALRYPAYAYGDEIELSGVVRAPEGPSAKYLLSRGIRGAARFPEITRIAEGKGSRVRGALFNFKERVLEIFRAALPREEAAFLSGIVLGETAEFTREFREKLQTTGTSHVVALSGYNITIIASSLIAALRTVFRRRLTFAIVVAAIVLFVMMTGAEASAVRAAAMGLLLLLADQVGRAYSIRNAIAIAAFLMVLVNPAILLWDLGFELSFAAILGLVYVRPALTRLFRVPDAPGFLKWRENLWTTIAAQLAVLPILLTRFGEFSAISILPNLLVLLAVPITMGLGFVIAGLGFISLFLAQALGAIATLLLRYALWVIDVFSRIDLSVSGQGGAVFFLAYYAILIGAVLLVARRMKPEHEIAI